MPSPDPPEPEVTTAGEVVVPPADAPSPPTAPSQSGGFDFGNLAAPEDASQDDV